MNTCIYCLRNEEEVRFNREHLFPESVGGKLFMDDFVCEECNSTLGSEVDILIFGIPEILECLDNLEIEYSRRNIYQKLYEVRAVLGDQIFTARATDDGFDVTNQVLEDGSLIVGDDDFHQSFTKSVLRDHEVQNSPLTKEEVQEEIRRLLQEYKEAEVDTVLESGLIGRKLIKRSNTIKIQSKPRKNIMVERLIAKIAYEFLFFIEAHKASSIITFLEDLFGIINTGVSQGTVFISRQVPPEDQPSDYHAISLDTLSGCTRIEVIFFGHISFLIIGPKLPSDFFDAYNVQFGQDIYGVLFEQDITKTNKKFALIIQDGELIKL